MIAAIGPWEFACFGVGALTIVLVVYLLAAGKIQIKNVQNQTTDVDANGHNSGSDRDDVDTVIPFDRTGTDDD